ncbi:hypothetical protein D6777_03490 [Candidatus Woesearchaeota archaeon]|nr:MAG: hypothetical protein D6777_03490 [Candidatus Woesearchaeota archaeon]
MKKLIFSSLCALVMACAPPQKKLEDCKTDARYSVLTKEGYRIRLYAQEDSLSVHIYDTKHRMDELYLNDNDFSKGNGVDSVRNMSRNLVCYKNRKPNCKKEELEKANQIFKFALKELGFDEKFLPENGVLGTWKFYK